MICNIFCFDQIWQLPSTQLTTNTTACLDHRCIIVYFTKHLLLGHLLNYRVKQKGEQRTVFNLKACQQKNWDEYKKLVNECLQFNMANSAAPTKSTLSADKKSLNYKWQILKNSILQAAKASLKTKKFGHKDRDNASNRLITLRHHLTILNKIFAFLTSVVFPSLNKHRTTTGFAKLQNIWSGRKDQPLLCAMYKDILLDLPFHIDSATVPTVISNNTLPRFRTFHAEVAALRNLVRLQRTALEDAHKTRLIAEYEKSRCADYAINKAEFLTPSLFTLQRSIIRD